MNYVKSFLFIFPGELLLYKSLSVNVSKKTIDAKEKCWLPVSQRVAGLGAIQ